MNTHSIILACGLLVALVAGMFTYTYLVSDKNNDVPTTTATTTADDLSVSYNLDRIDAKHFYRNSVHTIVGELPLPTPCDLLETSSLVRESMPEQILFSFSVINTTTDCAEVVTIQRFMIEATASAAATMTAEFNGTPIQLNLIEALDTESPGDFELYIKG